MVNEKTKQELMKCISSTGLPPHYFMALDKATVNKRTNQATIICLTIGGVKVPIIVGAPEVYSGCQKYESSPIVLKKLEIKLYP